MKHLKTACEEFTGGHSIEIVNSLFDISAEKHRKAF